MSVGQNIRYILAIIFQVIASLYLLLAIIFSVSYYIDSENTLRHEYMIGVWTGLLMATGFSLGSALIASTLKKVISKRAFQLLTFPALLIGGSFLMLYFGSIAYDLSTRS